MSRFERKREIVWFGVIWALIRACIGYFDSLLENC